MIDGTQQEGRCGAENEISRTYRGEERASGLLAYVTYANIVKELNTEKQKHGISYL